MDKKFVKSLEEYLNKSITVANTMKDLIPKINDLAVLLEETAERGGRIYLMGNGGSGANASHMAADLNKTAIRPNKKRFIAHCLNDNMPVLTAWSNDDSYESVFVEQLKNFLKKDDVVIAFSGSGNSKNVVKAIEYANEVGAFTVGISGEINENGGMLGKLSKMAIIVPDNNMYRIEDFHLFINHALIYAFKQNE